MRFFAPFLPLLKKFLIRDEAAISHEALVRWCRENQWRWCLWQEWLGIEYVWFMHFLIFFVQKSFLTNNYFLTAEINLTTPGSIEMQKSIVLLQPNLEVMRQKGCQMQILRPKKQKIIRLIICVFQKKIFCNAVIQYYPYFGLTWAKIW